MAYRVPLADDFALALGRAIYNYQYLEWVALNILERVDPSQTPSSAASLTGGQIAKLLAGALTDNGRFSTEATNQLQVWNDSFTELVKLRNDVLHSHPYTVGPGKDGGWEQGLWRIKTAAAINSYSLAKSAEEVHGIAHRFDDAAVDGNHLYYEYLAST